MSDPLLGPRFSQPPASHFATSFIILIVAAVGMVWGAVYLRRGSLLAGALAFLLSAAALGHDLWHLSLGPLPLTIDRLLIAGLAVAFVIHWRLGKADTKPIQRVDVLLAAFLLLLVISTFTADWRVSLPGYISPLWRLIVGYLMPAAVYWIVRQSPLSEKTLRRTCAVMFVFGAYLAITGLLEIAGQWSFVFPRYIADPYVGEHFGRARGPMVNSVSYGLMLSVCLLCGWAVWPKLSRGLQLISLLLAPVFLAGVFFSYTRSVWLGTALAVLGIAAVALRGRVRSVVLGGAVMGGLLIAAVLGSSILAFNRNDNTAAQTSQSVSMRGSFAFVSWQMFQDRPLLGFGFGQFPKEKLPYLSDRSTPLQLETLRPYVHHNTYLSLLTETGAVGLALFSLILVLWIKNGLALASSDQAPPWARRWGILTLAVLAVYATQAMFHELTYTPLDTSLVFFFAGITAGLQPLTGGATVAATATAPAPHPPSMNQRHSPEGKSPATSSPASQC